MSTLLFLSDYILAGIYFSISQIPMLHNVNNLKPMDHFSLICNSDIEMGIRMEVQRERQEYKKVREGGKR